MSPAEAIREAAAEHGVVLSESEAQALAWLHGLNNVSERWAFRIEGAEVRVRDDGLMLARARALFAEKAA